MAIIKKYSPLQNLSEYNTFLQDSNPNSTYFRISEFGETFTGGKNGFLIEGSECLKESTEIKIEILDVAGNTIYYEPGSGIPEYYEGTSKLISVHIYDDTPIGIAKITILGELKSYFDADGNKIDIPDDWKGVYNVKWEREFKVNKSLSNESVVRFYKRPTVSISEIVKPILSKTINNTTDTGNVNGFPLQPAAGQKLSDWRAGTNYLLQRTSGTWDIDVDESQINISSLSYNPTIIEVLNDTDVIVDIPYTDSSGNVAAFSNQAFSVTYQDIENETVGETSITGSFAKIDISQLKTFVGDVARVKIFRKSRNAVGDFQFVQEAKLESQELLRDVTAAGSTEVFYGKLTDSTFSTYWETSSADHPVTIESANLSRAAHIDYDTTAGGVQRLITSESISVSNDVEYTLEFKTLLSGSLSDTNKSVKAFFSSSDFTQDFLTISGSAIYRAKQNISKNIISENTGDAKLVFEVKGDDWFISNISLRNAQDTSFSPDEFTIIQDIPRKTATETFDFRFEFYDINNNFIPVNVSATKEFDGGNDFPTSGKLFTFESDRNAFRFSSGSIQNPTGQQIQFKTSKQNLTGSVTFASSAFDVDGNYLNPSDYSVYPGKLTSVTTAGAIVTINNFTGSRTDNSETPYVGSIVYTASLENFEEFETVYRLEDGDNAPQLIVTSDANQFIYEPTSLSPKPSSQTITIRAQRKNLLSLNTAIEVNSGSNRPALTGPTTDNLTGIDTYTLSATTFSQSFADNDFDSVTYSFTGSDEFGNNQSDSITISKVINFDAVSLVLSNESTSFPAKSTGEVTGGFVASSGSVQMFIGGNQIQHNDGLTTKNRFDITSITGSGVTPTNTSPTNANYSISAFPTANDSGSLTIHIDYKAGDNSTTQSFQKIVSYTKSKKAVPTVLTKVSPSTQTINSSSAGFETPQTMEVVVQEGGDEYTYDAALGSPNTFHINSLGYTAGSASFDDEIITLFTDSVGDGSGTFITSGLIGSASIDYKNSEGTEVYNKTVRFDLSVSKIGVDGVNGASGSDAKAVSLTSTAYAIKYDGDGNLAPSGQTFTLTATAQNFTTPEYQFLEDGVSLLSGSTDNTLVVPTDSGSLPTAGASRLYEIRVKEQGEDYGGVFDNIDVFGVQSGSDAFTTFLTNEAHVFTANSDGTVTSTLADGAFETRFFRGAQQYTYDGSSPYDTNSYRVENVTATGITITESTVSNQRKFTPTAVGSNEGTVTLDLIDNNTGQSFSKTYTFSKSKKGVPTVNISVSPQAQTITSSSVGGYGTPSNVTVKVSEGGTDYSYDGSSPYGNSTFRITDADNGTNNNDGTVTPPAVSSDSGYSETITLTYKNSEGTEVTGKTIDYNVGVAVQGEDGAQGPQGEQGEPGTPGSTGPGVVHTGVWESGRSYVYSDGLDDGTGRVDTVLWSSDGNSPYDTYYAANASHTSVATNTANGAPHQSNSTRWTSLGTQDFFVAAKIGIFEDSFVQNTLNVGSNNNGGADVANITIAGGTTNPYISIGQSSQGYGNTGIFIGNDGGNYRTSFVNSTTSYMKWTGTALEIKGDVTATSGDFDGAITIAGGTMKIGKDVNSTNDGIFINSNNYWYSNGNFKVGNADGNMEFDGSDLVVTGEIQATSGRLRSVTIGEGSNLLSLSDGGISGSGVFSLANTGVLTADGASISGEIEASGGNIGGWQIVDNKLQSSDGDVVLDPNSDNKFKISEDGATKVIISSGTQTLPITATAKTFTIPKPVFSLREITVTDDNFGFDACSTEGSVTIAVGEEGGYTANIGNSLWNSLTDVLDVCGSVGSKSAGECTAGSFFAAATVNFVLQVWTGSGGTGTLIDSVTMARASSFTDNDADNVIPSSVTFNLLTAGTYYFRLIRSYIVKFQTGGTVELPALTASGTTYTAAASVNVTYTELSKDGIVSAAGAYDYFRVNLGSSAASMVYATAASTDIATAVEVVGDQIIRGDLNLYAITSTGGYSGNGSISAAGNITAFASDDRLKIRLGNIENPLTKIMSLNGFKFRFNDFAKEHGAEFEDTDYVGVSAQEIEKVLPEVIKPAPFDIEKNDDGEKVSKSGLDFKTVQYEKIVPLLIEGIKELTNKVESLENELFKLKGK